MMKIRRYEAADFESLVRLWHETKRAAFSYVALQQTYTLEDDRRFFGGVVLVECEVWVAEAAGELLGFFALNGNYIDQFFVRLGKQRQGIGTALLAKAKDLSPILLRLYTFQKNQPARAFYERHGFRAVKFGISPHPENEPDVEYWWEPSPFITPS